MKSRKGKRSDIGNKKNHPIMLWTLIIAALTLIVSLMSLYFAMRSKKNDEFLEKGNFKVISITAEYNYNLSGRKPNKGETPQCPSIEVQIQNQSRLDQIFKNLWFVLESNGKLITRDGISMRLMVPRFSNDFTWITDCERLKRLFDKNLTKIIFVNQFNVEVVVTGDELKKLIQNLKRKYDRYDNDIKKYYKYYPISEN